MKILGLVGSQRRDGNSYLILRDALKGFSVDLETVQLADMRINWCNGCGLCRDTLKCVMEDDVNAIFNKVQNTHAVIFSIPRYLPIPSKFMALTERVGALYHFGLEADPSFHFPIEGKPFGLVVVSAAGGRQALEALKEIAFQIIHCWRMRLVTTDSYPFMGVLARGDRVGEALKDQKAIEHLRELIKRLTLEKFRASV
jgi:multimeric flavodoxin WrbA